MSRERGTPRRLSAITVISSATAVPFMSSAPRPQTAPSRVTPDQGPIRQAESVAGTTSMWLSRMIGRFEPSPLRRAYRLPRPGEDSKICEEIPSLASTCCSHLAPAVSLPGRIYRADPDVLPQPLGRLEAEGVEVGSTGLLATQIADGPAASPAQ